MPQDTDSIYDVYVRDRVNGIVELISVSSSGVKGQAFSSAGDISPDGRFVTFTSDATNLISNDTNNSPDSFVRDRLGGQTWRVSVGDNGQQGNQGGVGGSISADGRFVAFWSSSTNLGPPDANGANDTFVFDRLAGKSECVSVTPLGSTGNGGSGSTVMSSDGNYVAFGSTASDLVAGDSNGTGDAFVYERATKKLSIVSLTSTGAAGNGSAGPWAISADGRYVVFESTGSNFVPGDTNNQPDLFLRDRTLSTTTRISVSSAGMQADSESHNGRISANGRFIAFESYAGNLVPGPKGWKIFVHDAWLHTTTLVSQSTTGVYPNNQCLRPSISPDGTCVAFDSDANNLIQGGDTNSFTTDVMVRECPPSGAFTYCVPKTSSIGCIPAINGAGTASSSSALPFDVHANGVINRKNGLLTYSVSGQTLVPFGGGALCVAPPLKRSPLLASGGSLPPAWDCSGSFHFDFNAHIQSGVDPALVQGQMVWAQYWYRDPGFSAPDNIGLTDAVEFTIE
ncbi:MAG: hypothetical protein IT453_18730 [Planctomycetes bacterium]|nr:hypothetical protein [Planctomycetota bacterium]